MSDTFTLQIVTPNEEVEDTTASMVTLSGVEGDFGVLAGHAPLLTYLRPGTIIYDTGGMPRSFFVTGGFVEVTEDRVVVLAEKCESKESIDPVAANEAVRQAESNLAQVADDDESRPALQLALDTATVRVQYINDELETYAGH